MEEHKESSLENFEKFTWKIENFSKLNESVYHEHFVLSGYPWRIDLYPKGNYKADHLSILLKAVKTANMSEGWSRDVKFKISVFNQVDANLTIIRGSKNEFNFNANKDTWGYPSFISLVQVLDPDEGFLVNDTCIFGVEVLVCNPSQEKQVNTFESLTRPIEVEEPVPKSLSPTCLEPTKDPDTEFLYAALGRVLYFLKTRKVKDMSDKACKELQALWDELKKFKFDLTWLEPHVKYALGMKSFLEKAQLVEKLNENITILELETERLKAKLVTAELNLDIELNLLKAKGVKGIDIDSQLGCGSWI